MTEQAQGSSQDRQLTLNGKTYTLRPSLKFWARLEDRWELDEDATRARVAQTKLRDLPTIIWAAMASHHPDVPEEECLDLLDAEGAEGIAKAIIKLLKAGEPPPPQAEGGKAEA